MKMKAITLLVTAMFAVSMAAVVLSDDADAIDKGTVSIVSGGTAEVSFQITEPDNTYYTNTVTWTDGDGTAIYGNENPTGDSANATYTMSKVNDERGYAAYTLKITAKSDVKTTVNDTVTLTYKVDSVIAGSDDAAVSQTLTYNLTISIYPTTENANPLKESLDFGTTYVGTPITLVNVYNDGFTTGYVYYANGLPAGLQITPTGTIIGMPAEAVNSKTFTVVANHLASGATFSKEYTITVNQAQAETPADKDFTYSVTGAQSVGTDRYMVVQGTTEAVKVTTQISGSNASITSVKMNNSGTATTITAGEDGVYTLTDAAVGIGEYTIVLTNGVDEGAVQKTFTLVVVAQSHNVNAGIGFSPATQP